MSNKGVKGETRIAATLRVSDWLCEGATVVSIGRMAGPLQMTNPEACARPSSKLPKGIYDSF